MSVTSAFADYQSYVNADADSVKEARRRRDLFKMAFGGESDVAEVIASGSLRRGTQKEPIHDVDVIVIYDRDAHPDWGGPGSSAAAALDYTRQRVNALLGATSGTHAQEVRLARWRNHAVKCFLDDPDNEDAFTVDAMPAFRTDSGLLIPEALSEDWVPCDPEHLIEAVADKHAAWNKFAGTVRMLKAWAAAQEQDQEQGHEQGQGIKIKSLVMEVLALDLLPVDTTSQPLAVKEFFVRAARHVEDGYPVEDPAGICGPIQSDLDYAGFGTVLRDAADLSARAVTKQVFGDHAQAIRLWGEVFGDGFPAPPETPGKPAVVPPVVPDSPRPVKDTPQG